MFLNFFNKIFPLINLTRIPLNNVKVKEYLKTGKLPFRHSNALLFFPKAGSHKYEHDKS